MKKVIFLWASLLFASSANAFVIYDFTGGYAEDNWDYSLDGGTIYSGIQSLTMISSNANHEGWAQGTSPCCFPADTDFTITALGTGLVTFDWLYETFDPSGSAYDPFGYLLNDVFTQITVDDVWPDDAWEDDEFAGMWPIQSGTTSFSVTLGDVFGFRAHSVDGIEYSSVTVVSNFSAPALTPTPVSAPASLALFVVGLFCLLLNRKPGRAHSSAAFR